MSTSCRPTPSGESSFDLWAQRQRGDNTAVVALFEQHRGLVGHVLQGICRSVRLHAADRDDAFQEGCIGLLDAIAGYDPGRQVRFSSYATPHIHWAIVDFLSTRHLIRRPVGANAVVRQVQQAREALENQGEPVTVSALVTATGLTEARVLEGLSPVQASERFGDPTPTGRTAHSTFGDKLADHNAVDPAEWVARCSDRAVLAQGIHSLTPAERAVVERRYGIRDGSAETVRETAHALGVSAELVRQLEERALERLGRYLRPSSMKGLASS